MTSFIKIFCIITLFSLIPSFVDATTYYVDPGGSNANLGTEELPWLTPQFAANIATAGDTVIFKNGVYVLDSTGSWRLNRKGSAGAPIIFKAQNKHGAKIAKDTVGDDATIAIGVYNGASGGWQEYQEMYIELDGFEITGGKMHGIQSAGSGQLVIKNCKIHDTGQDSIKINSGADYLLIENNEIFNSGIVDPCVNGACNSDGIDVTSSDFVTIRDNHIHDILSWGMYVKKGAEYAIIERNKIHDIGYGGIGIGESTVAYNSIARNNILYNIQWSCLQFSGAKDSKFYNNTCYNVSLVNGAVWAGLRAVPAQHVDGARPGDDKYSKNVEFKNNIVVLNNDQGYGYRSSDPSFGTTTKQQHILQLHSDNNLFFNLTGGVGYSFFFEGHTDSSLINWRSYSIGLGNQQDANSLIADPLFESTDPNSDHFLHIRSDSPARGMGAVLNLHVSTDYNQNPRNAYDIGAFEYVEPGIQPDVIAPTVPSGVSVE